MKATLTRQRKSGEGMIATAGMADTPFISAPTLTLRARTLSHRRLRLRTNPAHGSRISPAASARQQAEANRIEQRRSPRIDSPDRRRSGQGREEPCRRIGAGPSGSPGRLWERWRLSAGTERAGGRPAAWQEMARSARGGGGGGED